MTFWLPNSLLRTSDFFFIFTTAWCVKFSFVYSFPNSAGNYEAGGTYHSDSIDNGIKNLLEERIPKLASWIISKGGRINDRQQVRPYTMATKSSSRLGVFAKQKITEEEELLFIPHDVSITEKDCNDGEGCGDDKWCNTVTAMLQLVNSEDRKPYFDYLEMAIENNQPPELWSREGKALIEFVTGLNLPPDEVKKFSEGNSFHYWHRLCKGNKGDTLAQNFTVLLDDVGRFMNMIPYLDLYNHRNGHWKNAEIREYDQEGWALVSLSHINKGDQIYVDFSDMNDDYDTANFFLRHGYIEELPHRWIIADKFDFTISEGTEFLNQIYASWNTEIRPTYNDISFFMDEAERLRSLLHVKELGVGSYSNLSKNEWEMTWKFHGAISRGIEEVLKLIENEKEIDESLQGIDANPKSEIEADWRDRDRTCQIGDTYVILEDDEETAFQPSHQTNVFFERPEYGDVCLYLGGALKICNHFRPHYQEPFVHFPAVLLKNMTRVAFIGGGDSMLLSEVLQYPEIEFVLGLEFDQQLVRQGFKYFHTQPHFDDERVQWWFGDATQSMKVLPKSYFGSFDLVMIDLSETAMSWSVTKNLDLGGALALLSKPDGIVVTNEKYYESFQKKFDYSMELQLRNYPTFCDQFLSIGSNELDLLRPDFNKMLHNSITTRFYKPLKDESRHNELIYRYTKNDVSTVTSYDRILNLEDDFDSNSNLGILMIVEAENTSITQLSKREDLEEKFKKDLQNIGFSPISLFRHVAINDTWKVILFLKVGYIVVQVWSEFSYCGFDVNFWADFDKIELVKKTLLAAVESKNSSSYRVIVGGMSGSVTHDADARNIGPRVAHHRSCNSNTTNIEDEGKFVISINRLLVEKYSKFLSNANRRIAHFCGNTSNDSCKAFETMNIDSDTRQYLFITSCSDDGVSRKMLENSDHFAESLCGDDIETSLYKIAEKYEKFETIVFDEAFPVTDFKRVTEVLSRRKNQISLVETKFFFIIPNIDDMKNHFVEKIRHKVPQMGSATSIEIKTGVKSKLSIFSAGHKDIIPAVVKVLDDIQEESGIELEISHIKGDPIKWQSNFNPHNFKQSDYDSLPSLEQYYNQIPLGTQSILQYERIDHISIENLTRDSILQCFEKALKNTFHFVKIQYFADAGDGIVIFAIFTEGHVVLVWDGIDHIDLNVFTFEENIDHESKFGALFEVEFDGIIDLMSKDKQPRGSNRVINFKSDLVGRSPNCWDRYLKCENYKKRGYCNIAMKDEWMDEEWMFENCPKSCGKCA